MSFFTLPPTGRAARKAAAAAKAKAKEDAALAETEALPAPTETPAPTADGPAPAPEPVEWEEAPRSFEEAAAAAYPSMRADYAPEEVYEDREPAAPEPRAATTRPTAVFVSNLPRNVTDGDVTALFRDCGVVREFHRVRDHTTRAFNGCAIITFGSEEAADLAMKKDGAAVRDSVVAIRRAKARAPRRPRDGDDEGGARFDALNNRLFPHEVAEAQLDHKKRRLDAAYSG